MKIKKVEISAFRAFDNIENSTFDFSLGENTANFVSIYAPNGYGKTSFYDAVEWAITGQISRFQKNAPENNKIGIENRKNNKGQYFLQHNGQEKLGFVNVFTDDINKKFPKKSISKSTRYDFNKPPINSYFRDVILSQDLIDTFIKEEKADDRYKKFISTIPHLNEYNTGLQNLIKLIENIGGEISDLKSQKETLEKKQLQFDFEGDSKVLEEINKSISFLIKKEEELSVIEKNSFSTNEHASITQKIDSKLTQVDIEIETLKIRAESIQIAFNGTKGDENKSGVIQYYSNIKKSNELTQKIDELKKLLATLDQKEVAEKIKLDLNKELDKNITLSDESLKIKKQYGRYDTIQKNINQLSRKVDTSNASIEEQKKIVQQLKLELSDSKINLSTEQKHIKEYKERFQQSSIIEERINDFKIDEKSLLKESSALEVNIKSNKESLTDSINKVEINKSYLEKLNNDIDLLLDVDLFDDFEIKISQALESKSKIEQFEKELGALNLKINNQKSLNSELKEFISKGLKLISEKEDTSCPLCLTDFNTYKELSESISNNPLIDALLKSSLTEKASLETQIKKEKKACLEIKIRIEVFTKELILKEEKNKNKTQAELDRFKLLLEKNVESLKILKEEKSIALEFFKELSFSDFKKKTNDDIQVTETKIKTLQLQIDITNLDIEKAKNIIAKTLTESQLFKNNIDEEKKNDVFVLVEKYFREKIKSNSIELSVLDSFIFQIETNSNDIKEKIKAQELKLNELNDLLANNNLSKEELNKQIELTSKVHLLTIKIFKNFENYIVDEFKIDLSNLSIKETILKFGNLKNGISSKIENRNEIQKHYKIVKNLKDKVLSFLETEKIKGNIESLKNEIGVYVNVSGSLVDEKNNLEVYLKESIDNFFYTELINKIYSKIDPHPDNYNIEFDCDFSDSKPRLQIYTSDSAGKKSVPALYFSSAQINILSLSIFLARALKATNTVTKESIKCIFIDDPIQSMDSINILSFIDLFRSLSVNLDRQLIVSTHEENFHLLLQKKIPTTLFKSKYIQFETFGKLEKMANA